VSKAASTETPKAPAESNAESKAESKAEPEAASKAEPEAASKAEPEATSKATPSTGEPEKTEPAAAAAAAAAPAAEGGAALPDQEMPFSNSTLHWLDDGEESARHEPAEQITVPGYDPTAPVAGRRRAVLVVGGAGVIALLVTGVLKVMAPHHDAAAEATAAEPARELTVRAQAAFDAHHVGEALELARLALVADPRFADAHFVVANCDRAHNQSSGAREEYRRYLELAPLGPHAAAARDALASLPP
jgi:hypothetical protein